MKSIVIKNIHLLVFVLLLFFFLFLILIDSFVVRNRVDSNSGGSFFEEMVNVKRTEIQPLHDNFNIVIIAMKNPGLQDHGDYTFQLLDGGGNVLRSVDFKGDNVGDPGDMRFQFDPVTDSKERTFMIKIFSSSESNSSNVKVLANKNGQLSYSLYYRTGSGVLVVKDVVGSLVKNIVSDWILFSIWVAALLLIYVKSSKV